MFKISQRQPRGQLDWICDEADWKKAKEIGIKSARELAVYRCNQQIVVVIQDALGKVLREIAVSSFTKPLSHYLVTQVEDMGREEVNFLLDTCYGVEYRADTDLADLRFWVQKAYREGLLSDDELASVIHQ